MKVFFAVLTLAIAALVPDQAHAWGPGVHLALGNSVLMNLGCLTPLIGALLGRHPNAFLYGCLSADIFIGKGTNFRPGHSHNWMTGFKLLKSSQDAHVTAYSYGYLTHLAADVVAHNFFVPNAMAAMRGGSNLSHVYVEMQADRLFRAEHETALTVLRQPNRASDDMLLSTMEKRRWPFLIKKQIIKGSLHFTGRKTWGHSLRLADRLLPGPRANKQFDEMFSLAENIVFDFLTDPENSPAVSLDPIGSRNLRLVRELRQNQGKPSPQLFMLPQILTCVPRPDFSGRDSARAAVGS